MTEPIASFTDPPVVEVVAGVAFDAADANLGPLMAAFWKENLRSAFPTVEQQPPYSLPVEQFPLSISAADFPFGLAGNFPTPRLWAISVDRQEILQLQPGYFACNWRKIPDGGAYDRWPSRRAEFERWFSELAGFLATEGGGDLKVTRCEVTYINHITPGDAWSNHSDFNKIFTLGSGGDLVSMLEQVSIEAQSIILGDDASPLGRLHVKILPALDRGDRPIYVLELTARGTSLSGSISGALSFLDRGRKIIDEAFLGLTTEAIHRQWGRIK